MMSPLVMLKSRSSVMIYREDDARNETAPAWRAPKDLMDQAGHWILQPVSSTEPAAFSPGTGFLTVNILSGSPCGGCASPTNTVLISSWSPARYSGAPGCSAISGGSLKPDRACASFGASSVFSLL